MTNLAELYASRHTHSHPFLRKAIGLIVILLPVVLSIGCFLIFNENNLKKSISAYYYTGMGDVFVGTLCAVAMFMFYDTGYNALDDWAGNLAGLFALGVAWFPPTESDPITCSGYVHATFAILLFLTLAAISFFLFPMIVEDYKSTIIKRKRKIIYKICGSAIVACLIAIGVYYCLLSHGKCSESTFEFWGESVALVAFGISWLTCGHAISPDKK